MDPLHKLVVPEFGMQTLDIRSFVSYFDLALVEAIIRKVAL